jgi:hypothetical protein
MKALSLTPWWAWIVAHGIKPVENRTWPTKYRGEFLIHASLGTRATREEVADFLRFAKDPSVMRAYYDIGEPLPSDPPRGGIVAIANLVDCVTSHPSPWFFGPYGFVLRDVRPLPFIPCRGALQFFRVPPDVEAKVREAA